MSKHFLIIYMVSVSSLLGERVAIISVLEMKTGATEERGFCSWPCRKAYGRVKK